MQRTRPSAAARAIGVLEGGDGVLSVLRYVERNPVKAGLATRAEDWPWSSAGARGRACEDERPPLTAPPGGLLPDWREWLNRPQSDEELAAMQRCIARGAPFGRTDWVKQMAAEWNLDSTLRPRGRPRKA